MASHSAIEIRPVGRDDVEAITALAHVIWHRHYPGIISPAQIEFMLAERYGRERLLAELEVPGLWWDQAFRAGRRVGFASSLLTDDPDEMKLDKLYVDPDVHRQGIGRALIEHVAARARENGCRTLILAVNKNNAEAIAAYLKSGFEVREAICVEISGGFVMDDYILAKTL